MGRGTRGGGKKKKRRSTPDKKKKAATKTGKSTNLTTDTYELDATESINKVLTAGPEYNEAEEMKELAAQLTASLMKNLRTVSEAQMLENLERRGETDSHRETGSECSSTVAEDCDVSNDEVSVYETESVAIATEQSQTRAWGPLKPVIENADSQNWPPIASNAAKPNDTKWPRLGKDGSNTRDNLKLPIVTRQVDTDSVNWPALGKPVTETETHNSDNNKILGNDEKETREGTDTHIPQSETNLVLKECPQTDPVATMSPPHTDVEKINWCSPPISAHDRREYREERLESELRSMLKRENFDSPAGWNIGEIRNISLNQLAEKQSTHLWSCVLGDQISNCIMLSQYELQNILRTDLEVSKLMKCDTKKETYMEKPTFFMDKDCSDPNVAESDRQENEDYFHTPKETDFLPLSLLEILAGCGLKEKYLAMCEDSVVVLLSRAFEPKDDCPLRQHKYLFLLLIMMSWPEQHVVNPVHKNNHAGAKPPRYTQTCGRGRGLRRDYANVNSLKLPRDAASLMLDKHHYVKETNKELDKVTNKMSATSGMRRGKYLHKLTSKTTTNLMVSEGEHNLHLSTYNDPEIDDQRCKLADMDIHKFGFVVPINNVHPHSSVASISADHPPLSPEVPVNNGHPLLSSKVPINNDHPSLTSEVPISDDHPPLFSEVPIKNDHLWRSSDTCYYCGSTNPLKNHPLVKWSAAERNKDPLTLTNKKRYALYVELPVGGVVGKFMVDTGATDNMVSLSLYNAMPHSTRAKLTEFQSKILLVLQPQGKLLMSMERPNCCTT
uniref:Uncharacterized protein LOC102805340 n=1 Tax=Saccoglossus kowalevskii TaxID=10224 RepID=A0ABM0M4N4_SACKO|nr:PREDICTED: uncharacterized protein LOC102805340 [Saccoglossus kowalevskii]